MKGFLLPQLAASTGIVGCTVVVHLVGLLFLLRLLQLHTRRAPSLHPFLDQAAVILGAAFGLFVLHAVEIWAYAAFYMAVREVPSLEDALYFSTSTYATIGYGDILLSPRWRILGAIEGANGVILLGWSTAFFVSIVQRLRALEHGWLEPRAGPPGGVEPDQGASAAAA